MRRKPIHARLFIPLLLALLFSACNNPGEKGEKIKREKKINGRVTDFLAAAEHEFEMLKNPRTGKIPEGIFDRELQQAKQILSRQSKVNGISYYSFQGPNNLGGRTRTIIYDFRYNGSTNQTIMAGGVSGGIFKSTDNGATWVRKSPTSEHYSCTSIAQDPRPGHQNTWYYATGEALGNSASATGAFYLGNGIYKSTDNGETWTRLANSNTTAIESFDSRADLISKVIVNPSNGDVYMACLATIMRSQDGGASWSTVLSGTFSNSGQMTDIVVTSTGRLYAAFGGTNASTVDGVWTSTTGNSGSWTRLAGTGAASNPSGWNSQNAYGRVVLGIAPSNENIVYALYYNYLSYPSAEAELFRYDHATGTWSDRSANLPDEPGGSSGNDPFAVQGGYDLVIAVKPDNEDHVFIGGTNIYRSTDGFATTGNTTRIGGYAGPSTYAMYTNSHPDIHAIVFQPTNPSVMLCGNDGGVQRTSNCLAGSVSWTPLNSGFRTFQYYYVTLDPRNGNGKVMGGAQDNGTTRNIGGEGVDMEMMMSGDGVSVGLSNLISGQTYEYVGWQNGQIIRRTSSMSSGFGTVIRPDAATGSGLFVTLFHLDPDNTEYLYYANTQQLYRNTSASTATNLNWTTQTGIGTAVGAANRITALATTRGAYNAATASLFIGTNNGRVYRLDNPANAAAATAPVDISTGLPTGYISSISVNPRNDDTVLVTFSNYGITNLWWTGNANAANPTWQNVEGNLTLPSIRSSVIAITSSGVEYFAGTSVGLYRALINGASPGSTSWSQEGGSEIGNAVVTSLALRPSDNRLLIGTHGYGMWATSLSNAVLPVHVQDFTGRLHQEKVLLQWKAETDITTGGFDVERSSDGISFTRIGHVPYKSGGWIDYHFTDPQPVRGTGYYRLKYHDNQTSSISKTITIKNNDRLEIYVQNPFSRSIEIRLNAVAGKVDAALFDAGGRLVYRRAFQGVDQFRMDPPAMSGKGLYILQLNVDGKNERFRIIRK